jgi:chemotaxis signal transduction protein
LDRRYEGSGRRRRETIIWIYDVRKMFSTKHEKLKKANWIIVTIIIANY